jgi:hypothetical protein
MCKRMGKSCPGPLEGALIVDMTANAKNGMRRQRKIDSTSILCARDTETHHLGRDPLVSTATTIAFYESFLNHFTSEGESKDIGNKLTWLERLPRLVTGKSDNALILALEATATAYGAIMTSNTTMTRQAHDLYGTALRAHQNMLQNRGTAGDVTIHMVSTSVLLSFFEAMQATTADAYRAHVYGAARLLEMAGPGECGHGVLCQLFYHVRTQMLFVQVATDGCNVPLSAKKILYDTLLYKDPPVIQKLMCCIAALQDLRTWNGRNCESSAKDKQNLRRQVDQLWMGYSARTHLGQSMEMVGFDDAFTTLTVSYFSAAYVLLEVTPGGSQDTSKSSRYAQVILDAAIYLDTTRNAVAYMRMAMPLLLVALHAQDREHRETTVGIFEIWSKASMRGISALALDTIRRHGHVDT